MEYELYLELAKLERENRKLKNEIDILTYIIKCLKKKYEEIGVKVEETKQETQNVLTGHKVCIKYLTIPTTRLIIPLIPDAISSFLNCSEVK